MAAAVYAGVLYTSISSLKTSECIAYLSFAFIFVSS